MDWMKYVKSSDGGAVGGREEDISIPLPGVSDPNGFQNWTMCVMGINITRKSLRKPIEIGAKRHLLKMPKKEIYHFETFCKCLNDQKVFHLEVHLSPFQKIKWKCNHELCWKILDHLLNFHAKRDKIRPKWDIPVPSVPESKSEEEKDHKEEDSKDADVICDNYFWDIMKLYTYNKTVEGKADSEKIDKIELVLLLQILSNCEFSQFKQFEERHEEKMRMARNDVMHSGDMSLSDESRQTFFQRLSKTLRIFSEEFRACKEAISLLKNLEALQLFKLAAKEDELTLVIGKALKSRKDALTFDIRTCIDMKEKDKLTRFLSSTCNQIRNFSVNEFSKKTQELQEKSEEDERKLAELERKVQSLKTTLKKEKKRRKSGYFQRAGRNVDRWWGGSSSESS